VVQADDICELQLFLLTKFANCILCINHTLTIIVTESAGSLPVWDMSDQGSVKVELVEFVPFLLNRAGSCVATSFSKILQNHELNLPMWRVLAVVHEKDGVRAGELATATSLEPSAISRILGTLTKRGLVRRKHKSEDARVVSVHLTADGRRLIERIIPHALEHQDVTLADFNENEIAHLKDMLRRLYRNMEGLEPDVVKA
jgi:DNA-binding MarR family transcriptional regulator